MTATRTEIRAGLEASLGRLWRYGVVLSESGATAEDLVRATCIRALERADDFPAGRELTWWLFTILRSLWLNYSSNHNGQGELSPSRLDKTTKLLPIALRSPSADPA